MHDAPSPVDGIKMQWGESLRWDDRKHRLYFVDSAAQTLHWLEEGEPPLHSLPLGGIPTGLILTEDARLVVALEGGLHVIDPEAGTQDLLAPYPSAMGARANDATADYDGNLVTGTLSLMPTTAGSYWWYSSTEGWRQLDRGIGNANGPLVLENNGDYTLLFADTLSFVIYEYAYDGVSGSATNRRVFADTKGAGGMPDGSCADAAGGVWSCILGAGKIVRYTSDGVDRVLSTGVELPSDVTFGGVDLERMYFVSIALPIAGVEIKAPNAGALMAIEGLGLRGRPEPRFRL